MTTSTESIKKCAHSLLACGSALVADEALWGDFLNCLSAMHAALALPPDPPSPDPPCPDCHEMTKQRDHYMQRADELGADNATLCAALETAARCAALETALEQERFRLAGCGVIADCNTEDALAEQLPAKGAYGDSASLRDVERTVRREMALADENTKLREALEAWRFADRSGPPLKNYYRAITKARLLTAEALKEKP